MSIEHPQETVVLTMQDKSTAFWIERCRRWANSITRNPESWHAKIDQVEHFSSGDEKNASRLVELLCEFVRAQRKGVRDIARIEIIEDASVDRPPLPLIGDLVSGAHQALVELDMKATNALLQAYTAADHNAPERLWILLPLADIGDPKTEKFFEQLTEEDIQEAIRTDNRLEMQAVEPLFSALEYNKALECNKSEIQETVHQTLTQIRFRYEQALTRRNRRDLSNL